MIKLKQDQNPIKRLEYFKRFNTNFLIINPNQIYLLEKKTVNGVKYKYRDKIIHI